jgi:hypothetical protein
MKTLLTSILLLVTIGIWSQEKLVPVHINLQDGGSIEARHFGQLKCGNSTYSDNYIFIRGKFLGNVTEIKDYSDIDKIVLDGYNAEPENSAGNQKGTLIIYKKNGKSFTLDEAEIVMSCYGVGNKYNQIVVQIENPINNQVAETTINTNAINSIVFK